MSSNVRKIAVVTSTRADYGLLKWIIAEISKAQDLRLQLVVSGTHLMDAYGSTVKEIMDDGFNEIHKVEFDLGGDDHRSMAHSIGAAVFAFTEKFYQLKPDMVLVLGDRFEILGAAIAAYTLKIPVAHIHGGETTSGALDEGFRHAVTKLSSLHFVAAQTYANRVIQLGEAPDRVICSGAPGIEGLHKVSVKHLSEVAKIVGLPLEEGKFLVVAYHPETGSDDDGLAAFGMLLLELHRVLSDFSVLFSMPNADSGGFRIRAAINDFVSANPNRTASFDSLGHSGFTSLVKHSFCLVGNSSSGVIEAPAIGTPSINIGNRQAGRLLAKTVISYHPGRDSFSNMIELAGSFQAVDFLSPPYGDGHGVATLIVDKLRSVNIESLLSKKFYDLPGPNP